MTTVSYTHLSKKAKTPNPNTYKEQKKNKVKLSYKEKQELQVLEELIPNLEKQIKDIDEQMNTISDFETIQKLTEERSSLEQQIDEKSERWMELLEKEEQKMCIRDRYTLIYNQHHFYRNIDTCFYNDE